MKDRLGWRMKGEEGQRRKLGGRCGKCNAMHGTHECTLKLEELRCLYPPCRNKVGHVTAVCHELTKSCNLPVCQGAWGHRSFCHSTIPVEGGEPYGYTQEAAEKLREEFSKFSYLLTDEEWEDMAEADNLERREGARGPVRRGRGGGGKGRPYERD